MQAALERAVALPGRQRARAEGASRAPSRCAAGMHHARQRLERRAGAAGRGIPHAANRGGVFAVLLRRVSDRGAGDGCARRECAGAGRRCRHAARPRPRCDGAARERHARGSCSSRIRTIPPARGSMARALRAVPAEQCRARPSSWSTRPTSSIRADGGPDDMRRGWRSFRISSSRAPSPRRTAWPACAWAMRCERPESRRRAESRAPAVQRERASRSPRRPLRSTTTEHVARGGPELAHAVAAAARGVCRRSACSVLPSTGNFVLVDRRAARGSAVYEGLLRRGVIVRPVGNYGLPNHLRITIGTAEQNSGCMRALRGQCSSSAHEPPRRSSATLRSRCGRRARRDRACRATSRSRIVRSCSAASRADARASTAFSRARTASRRCAPAGARACASSGRRPGASIVHGAGLHGLRGAPARSTWATPAPRCACSRVCSRGSASTPR